jgi:hypothetical protein
VRRTLIPLVLLTVAFIGVVAARGEPPHLSPGGCTWVGTPERDVKTGTRTNNVLCAKPGDDYIHGAAGNDELRAGKGKDVAVGGSGRDIIRGGPGPDRLFAVDDRGGDRIVGGPGTDQCFADRTDQVTGCERTFRSQEPEMAGALGRSLLNVMGIAEEVEPTPTMPPPVVTVTETDTITMPFPPCTPPPTMTPPPC